MTTYAIPSVPAAPRTGFDRIIKTTKAYLMHRRTERALNSLDDHLMRDIGLTPRRTDATANLMRNTRGAW